MNESTVIAKNIELKNSEDYYFLREEGIKHLQQLSGWIWTDHNIHDPGITILEALCYALTDIGYRTKFKVLDLITNESGKLEEGNTLFTCKEILPCRPFTINDYRKLLIDIDGVKNAWLFKSKQEVKIYADCKKDELTYKSNFGSRENPEVELNGLYEILLELDDDYPEIQTKSVLANAKKILHINRNLCEDIVKIDTVAKEEYFICADIEVTQQADIEKVQAEIFYKIEDYFSPENKTYSLTELMEAGYTVESIFNGPVLTNGFITDDELARTDLRKEIRISDLINLIMDIDDVNVVKELFITRYNRETNTSEKIEPACWRINVSPLHKPTLNSEKCKLNYYKGVLFFNANSAEVQRELQILIGQNLKQKLNRTQGDIYIEKGKYRSTGEYFSIQNDFPVAYGIGEFGIPEENYLSSEEKTVRAAQAKQLKAYLIFFEQILANYLAQLKNLRKLYSTETELMKTYFAQTATDIPGLNELVSPDIYSSFFENENIKKDLYEYLIEDDVKYYDRKNRVLDHLMSRFCESFTDYVLIMFDVEGNNADKRTDNIIIDDKSDFINSYPKLSSERGKAFDYFCNNNIWDTENVSGLEYKLGKLFGFDEIKRKSVFDLSELIKVEKRNSALGDYYEFTIITESVTLLKGSKKYSTYDEASSDSLKAISLSFDKENYQIKKSASGRYNINLTGTDNKILAKITSSFTDEESANEFIKKIINASEVYLRTNSTEGFHVIEQILFRPLTYKDKLMSVCIDEDCEDCKCCRDPYSFRIAVILPYWTERFSDMRFRYFVEDTIRYETPAHINARICWVTPEAILKFEIAYREWLQEKMKCKPDKNKLRKLTSELIEVMESLRSVYPESALHNCEDSENETSPVILNQTILGTINK